MAFHSAQLQQFTLAGSGVSISDTTMTLSSFQTIDGVDLAMADFGSIGYMTIEPGSRDREEQISFSGITQNTNGTATLTGIKTVLFLTPYTEASGFSKSHPGGVIAVVTNTSGFYNKFGIKENDETVTGQWSVPDPIGSTNVANKQWVLSVVNGGPVSVDQVNVAATAGETVAAGNLVYFKVSDGLWWKTDADTTTTINDVLLGIAQGSGTAGNPITLGVLVKGTDKNQSGLVQGSIYYASGTAGAITATAPTNEKAIGQAKSATEIYFDPYFYYIPTASQKIVANGLPLSDGSDGVIAFDGTNTFASFATKVSNTYTLTRDVFGTVITVSIPVTIETAGFKIFYQTSLTNAGTIQNNGGAGGSAVGINPTGGAAGTGATAGSLVGGTAGKIGGAGVATGSASGNNGVAGTVATYAFGVAGSAGGTGGQSGGTPGAAGTVTNARDVRDIMDAFVTFDFTSGTAVSRWLANAGSGSGSGGGSNTNDSQATGGGGGSGGGGGYILLVGQSFVNTGTIQANGGAGGHGGDSTNHGGGGGGAGGSGGVVVIAAQVYTNSGTIQATGGAGGTGGTTSAGQAGTNGTAGVTGKVILIKF